MIEKREGTVSVVIPIYNEEETVGELIRRLTEVLQVYKDYEILLVNDGSTDMSEALIKDFCCENSSVKLLSFSRNFGHQSAISAGLKYASGEAVVVMDGDLQDPPEVLPKFLKKWSEGYDVVYAIRKKRKENFLKRGAYFCFYRMLRNLSSADIPVDSGDFSVMDRAVVDKLNLLPERNRFVRGLRAWLGFQQIGVEYERDNRYAGKSKFTFRKLLTLAFDGLFSFSRKPLIIATKLGITITLISFILIGIVIWQKIFFGVAPKGWTSMIVVIAFFGGIQLVILGIIGEYIGRIFDEVKGRPDYMISVKINIDS